MFYSCAFTRVPDKFRRRDLYMLYIWRCTIAGSMYMTANSWICRHSMILFYSKLLLNVSQEFIYILHQNAPRYVHTSTSPVLPSLRAHILSRPSPAYFPIPCSVPLSFLANSSPRLNSPELIHIHTWTPHPPPSKRQKPPYQTHHLCPQSPQALSPLSMDSHIPPAASALPLGATAAAFCAAPMPRHQALRQRYWHVSLGSMNWVSAQFLFIVTFLHLLICSDSRTSATGVGGTNPHQSWRIRKSSILFQRLYWLYYLGH